MTMETTDIAAVAAENTGNEAVLDSQIETEGAARDLTAEFEELIRGEYKDAFTARVKGILVKRFREKTKDEPENNSGREHTDGGTPVSEALIAEAEELKLEYPVFDLEKEKADPAFSRLIAAGVDLRTAYEVTHRDTVFPERLRAAVEGETRRVWQELHSASQRISESSRTASPARVSFAADTRSAREALERRALKGEKIIL